MYNKGATNNWFLTAKWVLIQAVPSLHKQKSNQTVQKPKQMPNGHHPFGKCEKRGNYVANPTNSLESEFADKSDGTM